MSDDKFDQAAFKIFELTHEGELDWLSKPAPGLWTKNTDSSFPIYFETNYQGRKLALFLERMRASYVQKALAETFDNNHDDWRETARLALLGDNDEILFAFPPSRQIKGLLEAVRYKEANVEQFLDELLKSEPVDLKQ